MKQLFTVTVKLCFSETNLIFIFDEKYRQKLKTKIGIKKDYCSPMLFSMVTQS